MTNNEFILEDRIAKIQAINEQYDLEHNSYIAFSGGWDSKIVSDLIDIALPNNHIPRVFANTGLEYNLIVKFVRSLAEKDDRFIILNQVHNIKNVLTEYGYPFKSKEHSLRVFWFNKGSNSNWISKYITGYDFNNQKETSFKCPKCLLYQFKERGKYNYSNKCCYILKKDLQHNWQIKNNKSIVITGMKNSEGGNRSNLTCLTNNNTKFHPIVVCTDEWESWFVNKYNVSVCDLYLPPYNFKRTGCVGCPFNDDLQFQLDIMKELLPSEYKRAEILWKPVYDEYRRIGYRLRKDTGQTDIFDFINGRD